MSEERSATVISSGEATVSKVVTEDQKTQETRTQKKARLARVLERGFVGDRTVVDNLPPHLHGEWIARDVMAVERAKSLGFWIDTEYAPKRSLHSEADKGQAIIGDTVFMTCLKEDKQLIDEIRNEQYIRQHGTKEEKLALNRKLGEEEGNLQREEKTFNTQVENELGMPVIDPSKISVDAGAKTVRKEQLLAALSKDT